MAEQIGNTFSWTSEQHEQSPEAAEFLLKYGEHLNALTEGIGQAFAEHDGNTIMLINASLMAMIHTIAERIEEDNVQFILDTQE